ncbi:GNAT family N-acetyltransferase [Sporolactobacillus sp. CPB3-1]|uniref:GNAT family N-acetyltransferase n=1 Tax=Sporolactobacillus mangiferae TaxID=2940498 RepID=A0ABT0MCM6_9BACL|nr:GNAT family N-acetyltransferase [Sporolactobacillus mangiferae]MCL1632624.1 GNAT family N-acetyltransferase [Sporolactobacillus mangiferae]
MLVYENKSKKIKAFALDREHWHDFSILFGERGACGGCWCMNWRLKKSDFEVQKGKENQLAMRRLVESGEPVGILLYVDGSPVGWCAVAPRKQLIRLTYSRVFKQLDDLPVWSITCFFIAKTHRRMGLSAELIQAAVRYGMLQGAPIIEAYPEYPYDSNVPDAFLWKGVPSVFRRAGFTETVRHSKWKLMMRYIVDETSI